MITVITSRTTVGASILTATAGASGDIAPEFIGVIATTIPGTEVTAITTIHTNTAATAASCLEPTGRMASPFITWTEGVPPTIDAISPVR